MAGCRLRITFYNFFVFSVSINYNAIFVFGKKVLREMYNITHGKALFMKQYTNNNNSQNLHNKDITYCVVRRPRFHNWQPYSK